MDIKKLVVVPVAIGAMTVGIAACGSGTSTSSSSSSAPAATHAPAAPAADGKISMAKFNQIQAGMSLEQVQQLAGSKGKLQSQSDAGGYSAAIYSWDGDKPLSNVTVEFSNGQVMSKSQFGLDS